MSLYPTPTRKRRLRDVALGLVFRFGDGHDYDTAGFRRDALMAEMARAGWVELGPEHPVKRPWLLTEAGKAVLDEAAAEAVWREVS